MEKVRLRDILNALISRFAAKECPDLPIMGTARGLPSLPHLYYGLRDIETYKLIKSLLKDYPEFSIVIILLLGRGK